VISIVKSKVLNASKMIIRPERVTQECLDPYLGQTDCRYDEGPLPVSEPVPENATPHPRAEARKCCSDDYASRLVVRRARAIQCGWHQGQRRAYTPGTNGP
jgi:hypothetical protein